MNSNNIISTCIFAICGILAIALIVMAIVPKNFKVEINYNPDQVSVYNGSTTALNSGATYYKNSDVNKEVYKTITSLFEKSFSTSSLSALFSGTIGNNPSFTRDTKSSTTLKNDSSTFVLEYIFNEKQTVKKDGKDFTSEDLTTGYTNGKLEYGKLWIVIDNHEGFGDVNIYVHKLDSNGNASNTYTTAIYRLTTLGNTLALYNYLTELKSK